MSISRSTRIYLLILSFIMVIVASIISQFKFWGEYSHAVQSDIHWMVALNGKYLGQSHSDDPMSDFGISLNKGDVLTMATAMEDTGHIDFPTIFLQSRYCAFNVYIDGEFYKAYNMSDFRNNRYIGRNVYMVSLPGDYRNKFVKLEIFTAKNGIRETVTNTLFGNHSDLEGSFIRRYLAPFLITSAMIIFGLIMMILSLVLAPFRPEMAMNLYAGGLFAAIGLGLHCYYGLTSTYARITHETELCEVLLLLIIPLFMIYLRILYPSLKQSKVYALIILITFINFMVRVFLHYTKVLYLGFTGDPRILQMLSAIPNAEYYWMIVISSFATFFLFCGMYRFFKASTSSIDQNVEYGKLTQVAFEDPLTGLSNRAGLNDQFEIYDSEGKDYYIIHFDVNDLKKTNDTYGHEMGDKLLKCFANALNSTFGRTGVCARQGGDEFTVLLRTKYDETIMKLFEKLDRQVAFEAKKEGLPFEIHAARGYSYRSNFKTIHEASMAADQHMYDCKHRMKTYKDSVDD